MNEQIKYGDTKEWKSGRTMRDLVSGCNLLIQYSCIMLCYTSILFIRRMNARLEGCMEEHTSDPSTDTTILFFSCTYAISRIRELSFVICFQA